MPETMIKSKLICTCLLAFISFSFFSVNAATPSQAQIEQFKRLPKAQQEALAVALAAGAAGAASGARGTVA